MKKIKNKILYPEQIKDVINDWKQSGNSIVFTNGCFDLLHTGHIDYLSKAAGLGDILIIGVNSDVSVKKLKGENRPLITEYKRCLLLAALLFTDAVIVFEEETPENLIRQIKPDMLVKGGDYKFNEIAGYKDVIANRGSVALLPFLKGESSTSIEKQILSL